MPFCPSCGAEYRPGVPSCSDCDVPLVAERPSEPPVGTPTREGVVGRYGSEIEAEMWAEMLRAEGIPCRTLAYLGDLVAFGAQETSPHLLLVREADVERARAVLEGSSTGID